MPGTKWRGLTERSPFFKTTTAQNVSPATGKYTVLFEDAAGAQPVIAGELTFASVSDRDVSGSALWTVPSGYDSRILGGLSRKYPVVGARYPSSLTSTSPARNMLDYNASGAATFSFEFPSSARIVDVARNIGNARSYSGLPAISTLKFSQGSGYYTGTFSDDLAHSAKFQGWVLDHPAQNRGHGYIIDTHRLGSVSLTPEP